METKITTLKNALSPYYKYCDGYGNVGASGNSYILGLTLGVGVTRAVFSHRGSGLLDQINAFDIAETDGPYIGQLNMSNVSSFCGPQGLIWGYDIVRSDNLYSQSLGSSFKKALEYKGEKIRVYDASNLIGATQMLLGTVDKRRFVLRPGAHVPFAGRNKFILGQGVVYAAVAIGIPKNRDDNACLLMEDVGILRTKKFRINKTSILRNMAKSVIEIGQNQRVSYTECFVAIKSAEVGTGQVGCALVAAPYFTLARNAVVKNKHGKWDFASMFKVSLSEWERKVLLSKK